MQTFTREEGNKSFFTSSSRAKGKSKTILSPLGVLDIETTKGKGDLLRIKEANIRSIHLETMDDFRKTSILMFCNEVLLKCLSEYHQDEDLFDFIEAELQRLNDLSDPNDFHLEFLLGLSSHLGFYPNGQYSESKKFFDLIEGCFTDSEPLHKHFISPLKSPLLSQLLHQNSEGISMSNDDRRLLLDYLLDYFRIHVESFNELKSKEVLRTVLT